MVLGLLAPELVVWNAWEQRKKVKRLSALMRRRGFMPKESTAQERISGWFNRTWQNVRATFSPRAEETQELADLTSTRIRDRNQDRHNLADVESSRMHNKHLNAWTDVHSWLVVMGGFAFEDKSPEDQQFMPGTLQRIPINRDLFAWMVRTRPHLIPDISRAYIEDKSKSDWLAKGLTCWQSGYFCIQCSFRLSQQLSITLLELNVFAHAICALLLFLVWWDKPRDILVPTTISSEEALQICARHLDTGKSVVDARGAKHHIYPSQMQGHSPPDECFELVHPTTIIFRKNAGNNAFMMFADGTRYKYLKVRGTYWRLDVLNLSDVKANLHPELGHSSEIAVVFQSDDISRLGNTSAYNTQIRANREVPRFGTLMAPILNYRTPDWSFEDHFMDIISGSIRRVSDHVQMVVGITFASACYGGLHLNAWTNAFPSHAALMMWRAASITLLATGPFCLALAALFTGLDWSRCYVLPKAFVTTYFPISFTLCLLGVFIVWYILCRTFIVVECCILLAHIPESALRVTTWAAYIPSFG
jgi:hypothetical protein